MWNNKSVLFRSFSYFVTQIGSPGRIDITLSTKYLRRSRRANILYFKNTGYVRDLEI
jgi:hypothetical protein